MKSDDSDPLFSFYARNNTGKYFKLRCLSCCLMFSTSPSPQIILRRQTSIYHWVIVINKPYLILTRIINIEYRLDHINVNTTVADFICIIILSALDFFSESCNSVSYSSAATIFLFCITYQNWRDITTCISICLVPLPLLPTLKSRGSPVLFILYSHYLTQILVYSRYLTNLLSSKWSNKEDMKTLCLHFHSFCLSNKGNTKIDFWAKLKEISEVSLNLQLTSMQESTSLAIMSLHCNYRVMFAVRQCSVPI